MTTTQAAAKKFGNVTVTSETTNAQIATLPQQLRAAATKFRDDAKEAEKSALQNQIAVGTELVGTADWDALKAIGVGTGNRLPLSREDFEIFHESQQTTTTGGTGKTIKFIKLQGVCSEVFTVKEATLPGANKIKFVQGRVECADVAAYPFSISAKMTDVSGNIIGTFPAVGEACEVIFFEDDYNEVKNDDGTTAFKIKAQLAG